MASLKDLRVRIRSVKSTQKITSAMKVVAASRLRRAQEQAEAARPYAERMGRMLGSLAAGASSMGNAPRLLAGTGKEETHLLIVATSDRGLAGGFNATILRETRRAIRELQGQGKTVKLFTIGRKARDGLRRDHGKLFVDGITEIDKPRLDFTKAEGIARRMLVLFEEGQFDVASIVYNRFKSAMTQIVTKQRLVPFEVPESADRPDPKVQGIYEFEPEEAELLARLLPRNLAVQLYTALLENAASEQGARMTAMDNATRNAGDMIDRLTITYNRSRQAAITKELIEIISGAEAL
ncbi:MAG TPA: F0F1 ATP synthase subunit gamma [Stellaceae bacterium]|nr:F0F1 ATP synthase subunit gamma [Stellaceae bacterium]